eukprot:TRINITY_DN10774_c0_g1_i1.p1 TRINITY_DN10774_c0_g1~~TRINITY_DN10774_c0_g1_i1.p1  ORF type:complete len:437 (+),score=85.94 TRINITY_DN10774_c0_g1_i1:50-1360(+)
MSNNKTQNWALLPPKKRNPKPQINLRQEIDEDYQVAEVDEDYQIGEVDEDYLAEEVYSRSDVQTRSGRFCVVCHSKSVKKGNMCEGCLTKPQKVPKKKRSTPPRRSKRQRSSETKDVHNNFYHCKYCDKKFGLKHFKNRQQFGIHCSNCSRELIIDPNPRKRRKKTGNDFKDDNKLDKLLTAVTAVIHEKEETKKLLSQVDQLKGNLTNSYKYEENQITDYNSHLYSQLNHLKESIDSIINYNPETYTCYLTIPEKNGDTLNINFDSMEASLADTIKSVRQIIASTTVNLKADFDTSEVVIEEKFEKKNKSIHQYINSLSSEVELLCKLKEDDEEKYLEQSKVLSEKLLSSRAYIREQYQIMESMFTEDTEEMKTEIHMSLANSEASFEQSIKSEKERLLGKIDEHQLQTISKFQSLQIGSTSLEELLECYRNYRF